MTNEVHADSGRRHDFTLLFDVTGGNPNGDPDNGNAPRMDPETGHGWVTDVAIKRKIRNFVASAYGDREGFEIYVKEGVALNAWNREESEKLNFKGLKGKETRSSTDQARVAAEIAKRFYDVRAFGAVMSTKEYPAGQLRGPVQFVCPSVSVDPIEPADLTITRVAVTREDELAKLIAGEGGKDREMGSKNVVPYALFRVHGFFTPSFAEKTGFSDGDLNILWDSLIKMWSLDRSSSRGMTGARGLHIFSHEDRYGRGHPDDLFRRIEISKLIDGSPRSFEDYKVNVNTDGLSDLGILYACIH